MGFFTSKDKVKEPSSTPHTDRARTRLHQKSRSLFGPPNVYAPVAHPPQPQPRPAPEAVGHGGRRGFGYHHYNASSPQIGRTAGYLTAPPDRPHPDRGHICGPVVVNQHYYLNAEPPLPPRPGNLVHQPYSYPYVAGPAKFSESMQNLSRNAAAVPSCDDGLSAWYGYSTNLLTSTVTAFDEVSARLNHVLTLIDVEHLKGHEMDLFACRQPTLGSGYHGAWGGAEDAAVRANGGDRDRHRGKSSDKNKGKESTTDLANSVVQGNYFSKVELYANAKLPRDLAPFAVYMPTWPLLSLAAQYSLSVYERPSGAEREAHVSSDWRTGTKAMRIKSVPMDHMNTIVFAIRGTASFMDWAVNLNAAPTPPTHFLDDPGNLCHTGFLSVARRMVKPVAARLRQLLEEDPSRCRCSLLITGHSAGGAVAALLYSHMLAQSRGAKSELNLLTTSFKKVHCVTFGTPPVSLLPLEKPDRPELKNSLFLSFVNEGDPVVRADKGYVKSLLELLASPPPAAAAPEQKHRRGRRRSASRKEPRPVWHVPPSTLSNAGRIVVLRSGRGRDHDDRRRRRTTPKDRMTVRERLAEGVTANVCRDEQLRGVIWGDPVAHLMKLYAGRIEALAVQAVTAGRHRA